MCVNLKSRLVVLKVSTPNKPQQFTLGIVSDLVKVSSKEGTNLITYGTPVGLTETCYDIGLIADSLEAKENGKDLSRGPYRPQL